MFSTKLSWSCRHFHTSHAIKGSQVKEKLRNFEKHHVVIGKTSKELARLGEKKALELKRIRKRAYSKQQAMHVLKTKYGVIDDKTVNIGPTSQSDSNFLAMTKDRRMLYSILGVNGEQLRDSRLIADDVKKFLKRGQIEKAVFLTRLAKNKGSAGMNMIMDYYFHELGYSQSAIKLYTWRKKWGIPPNEYTNTILFNGLAQQKQHISGATGDFVLKIVDDLIANNKLSQIEFNAAVGALSNCMDVTPAFELYERKTGNVRRDAITFLWMLRACSRVKTDRLFKELLGGLMEKIPFKCVDSQLIFEFCKALNSRSDNKEIKRLTLRALYQYFEIDISEKLLPIVQDERLLQPLAKWSIEKRFSVGKNVIGLFLENCLQTGEYELGVAFFAKVKENQIKLIDLDMFHNYMELIMKKYPTECGEECLKVFEEMEANGRIAPAKHSIILVYKAFSKQANRKFINCDEIRVEKLLKACQNFIRDQEGVHSKEFNAKIYPIQSWQFLLSIVKGANSHDKISTTTLKLIIDEYSKSLCHGVFDRKDGYNMGSERFVELECVRLLKTLSNRLEIPGIEDLDISAESSERNAFLLRRLLLRFKDKLLEHITSIEKEGDRGENIADLEWSLKQLARRILSSEVPSL